MAHTPPPDAKLIAIEEALDRRTNHNGMVEYLVKLKTGDKLEWVPWNNIYCPQLVGGQQGASDVADLASSSSSSSSRGIIDV